MDGPTVASPALPSTAPPDARARHYDEVLARIALLVDGEDDWIAALSTAACELHHAFGWFHWTGFYRRRAGADLLVVGPYQGGHGCLRITFDRGVCGAAARTRATQRVPDVAAFPGHIACSSTTRSEIVVPLFAGGDPAGEVVAVLDVDSDLPEAFSEIDQAALERLAAMLGRLWPGGAS
ncbi:MAG: GAF domain-containing protein [Deltaproteobacteria bacterium]|nr:GAF domain-containing protein [Deltaproteobacteria bacterium]